MEDRENSNSLEGRIIQGDFRHQRHSILGLALYLSAGTLAAVGACELYMQGNYFWAASVAWTLV